MLQVGCSSRDQLLVAPQFKFKLLPHRRRRQRDDFTDAACRREAKRVADQRQHGRHAVI
jgi:hypothetical protein